MDPVRKDRSSNHSHMMFRMLRQCLKTSYLELIITNVDPHKTVINIC